MAKRRGLTSQFRARVAPKALRREKTISQVTAGHKLHPNQRSHWKRQAIEKAF